MADEQKKDGLWGEIVNHNCEEYDKLVTTIKNFYAPNDDDLAYKIEDEVNAAIVKLIKELDKKYLEK